MRAPLVRPSTRPRCTRAPPTACPWCAAISAATSWLAILLMGTEGFTEPGGPVCPNDRLPWLNLWGSETCAWEGLRCTVKQGRSQGCKEGACTARALLRGRRCRTCVCRPRSAGWPSAARQRMAAGPQQPPPRLRACRAAAAAVVATLDSAGRGVALSHHHHHHHHRSRRAPPTPSRAPAAAPLCTPP